jgi:serine/threonine protein phosphatase PrpC
MRARAFITPKGAESKDDCQDRFSINIATGSVAVSDGMSQSLFPKYWAEILADKYTSDRDWVPSQERVRNLSPLWREIISARMEEMRAGGLRTWRAENMLSDGFSAGATLVGLRLDGNHYRCDVLGDSCLVVIQNGRIRDIFSSMDCFGNYPDYYDSDPGKPGKGELRSFEGEITSGMVFLLVSDPLAGYLSSVLHSWKERILVGELLSVESQDEFEILVDYWRQDGMHNDDTTMVMVWQQR